MEDMMLYIERKSLLSPNTTIKRKGVLLQENLRKTKSLNTNNQKCKKSQYQ